MSATLPLAGKYQRFRADVFGRLEESCPLLPGWPEPMTELQVQSLWFAGEFGTSFTSEDNEQIVIRDFGVWNSGAGPDFKNCSVTINGISHTGDIELDPDVRDWDRHQHGTNVDFNRVVLHVFIDAPAEARAFTRTSEFRQVPQVRLTSAMLSRDARPNLGIAAARLGRCAKPLSQMPDDAVLSLIEAASQHRLQNKSKRLHQCVAAHGREQTVYQALAQTLGYKSNTRPFLLLAQRLPVRRLLALEPMHREALLFGVADFLAPAQFEDTTNETRSYLRTLWEHWWKERPQFERWLASSESTRWNLKASRPGNHPQRRLGALAAMVSAWNKISRPLHHAEQWNRENWTKLVASLQHDYWTLHYTLNASPAKKPVALIGETRVYEMLANVVYPLLVPENPKLWREYLELPAMLENQKVRLALLRLFGTASTRSSFCKRLHQQQGLIQIYEDFCLIDDSACADCPFPERLTQWS